MLKDLTKKALYASGLLGLYNRFRNADCLTVVMFHRIMPPGDPRYATCDLDYTLTDELFGQCLRFFQRHYNMVSEADVLASRRSGKPLPRNPLLVTFDDGWADNADHALGRMRDAGLPGLLFVVSDAVGRLAPFPQDAIMSAWRRGVLTVSALADAIDGAIDAQAGSAVVSEDIGSLRAQIARFEALDAGRGARVTARLAGVLDDGMRHMADADELLRLHAGGVALGLHGKTHVRMTLVDDLDAELGGARKALSERLGPGVPVASSMSFPHGAYDSGIARKARDTGYELVFTSKRLLNRVDDGVEWLLGRTGFETGTVTDAGGRFRPDLLALELFRCPRGRL